MDRWGPKYVGLTCVMNKLTHQNTLCILLDCIYSKSGILAGLLAAGLLESLAKLPAIRQKQSAPTRKTDNSAKPT